MSLPPRSHFVCMSDDMSIPTLYTPRSVLMHASLAYLSAENQILESIITISPTLRRPTAPSLPTELLLIIRHHLLRELTAQYTLSSLSALAKYESSLQDLLCVDCIEYNHNVYGPDIWQWEHFTGPCACTGILQRRAGFVSPHSTTSILPPSSSGSGLDAALGEHNNPQRFSNPHQWLEWYLSRQALYLPAPILSRSASTAPAVATTTPPSPLHASLIWEVVSHVLSLYECEIASWRPLQGPRRRSGYAIPFVPIAAVERGKGGEMSHHDLNDVWRASQLLRRVDRDLGLADETQHATFSLGCQSVQLNPPTTTSLSTAPTAKSTVLTVVCQTGHWTVQLIGACLVLPVTFLTLALTVLCFYTRPWCLRIL